MLSMGANFDMVINLDGFNEIVLPMTDNRVAEIHSTYPRNWQMYARKGVNMDQLLATGHKISLAKDLNDLDRSMSTSIWRASRLGLMFWDSQRTKLMADMAAAELSLQASMNLETDRQLTGPEEGKLEEDDYRRQAAEYWAQCSKTLHGLCKGNSIEYFHFRQPNQYVEDSKKFTEQELAEAYEHGPFAYKEAVVKGYPMLGAQGDRLLAAGVPYFDLTQIFANVSETMYADKCCHLNTKGSEQMAKEMAERISYEINNRK